MLDHVFTDAIGALREALENALLERQAFEERFQTDILLGDTTWLSGQVARTYVEGDLYLVDADLWADNQRGERTAICQATAILPAR